MSTAACVDEFGDFLDVSCVNYPMVSQSQSDRARHECHRGQVLAQPVMQFLAQPLLLAIADREDFPFQALCAG